MDCQIKQIKTGVRNLSNVIKIVNIGKYVGAVKYGRCPMYALTTKDKVEDFKAGLAEDYPECKIDDGTSDDRKAVAQFILRSRQR